MNRRSFLSRLPAAVAALRFLPTTTAVPAVATKATLDLAKINAVLPAVIESGRKLQVAQSAFYAELLRRK